MSPVARVAVWASLDPARHREFTELAKEFGITRASLIRMALDMTSLDGLRARLEEQAKPRDLMQALEDSLKKVTP